MFKRKHKQNTPPRRQVKSVYSDQIILEDSLAKCECEIYLPEPSAILGIIKGNYLLRESGTVLLGKSCMVYLCSIPIPYSPLENTLLVKDIGQDNEVYLHIILNRHKKEDLVYTIKEPHWHECARKINDTWRTFVLKFNKTDKDFETFNEHVENVIDTLETLQPTPNTYLLVAVPLKDQLPVNTVPLGSSPQEGQIVLQLDNVSDIGQSSPNRSSTGSDNKTAELEIPFDPGPLEAVPPVKEDHAPTPPPAPCEGSVYPTPQPCAGTYDPVYDPVSPTFEAPFDPAPYVPLTDAGEEFNNPISEGDTENKTVEENYIKPSEISEHCDSLHIHPKELPRRLASILNSIGSISSDTDPDNQRLDSQHLISEEVYMQMGVERKMTTPSSPSARLQEAMKTAKSLQKAINEGDQQLAVMNAVKLAADINVTVTIEVKEKTSQLEDRDPVFSLKVYIEDKDTSGGHIILKVRASDTIGDLKQRMSFKHQFPEEIQSWIIGKRIPADHETLGLCKIKGPGHSAYLYLRTARSVGITREAYQKRWMEQFYPAGDGNPVVGGNQAPAGVPLPQVRADPTYMAMNAVPQTPAPSSAGSQPPSREPGSATPPSKQGPAVKQEAKDLADNLNTPTQKGSKPKQVVQGRNKDHSHIPEDRPLDLSGAEIRGLLDQFANFSANAAQEKPNTRVPGMHSEDETNIGWVCSACTYINKPTRPGCEVCTQTRPTDYKVPDNYVLSPEEQEWLDEENRLDRQTKEAGNLEREYEDFEQKRLDNVRKFHEALQDVVAKDQSREGDRDIYRAYNIPPNRLDIGGLFAKARRDPAEATRLAQQRLQSQQNYVYLQQTDARDLVPNTEEFTCTICYEDIGVGEGVVLRNCLHHFCKGCLADHVGYSEEPGLQCPYVDDNYTCDEVIQDREVRALVSSEIYDKYLARSLQTAESQAKNSFHCKTADCPGWCIYEDHVNFFVCPVCRKENCLTCKAIHQGMNCKQYQDDLRIRAANDKAANQTQTMIQKMVSDGDAMPCPQCQVIVMKKEGCDWIQCSICKTEICWVTKGPRWGPLGSGDTTGGCRCRVDGLPCHPNCNNCH